MNANIRQPDLPGHHEMTARPFFSAVETHITADAEDVSTLQAQINALLEEIDEQMLRALMLRIFSDLTRLLAYLRMSETALERESNALENLAFFTLVHEEALALRDFVEGRALRADCIDAHLRDALGGISFAITHELRRVYEQELAGLNATEADRMIRGRIGHVRGLLSNCFQQSLIILAQAFDPSLSGTQLFNDLPARVQQSIVLRRDLWTLVQLARRAEAGGDLETIISFIQYLETFRHGSMHFLMYRDWQVYERFVDEVMETGSVAELAPVLDSFACYLETLFAQVRMRAVLANHPFDCSEADL
ncbi:MAG TPA: hypothetical protein VE842_12115 [Pyrinomonadaceae bacterium]|jgi:hypothetical protein|nr:hypothetical protein [Pyrinomonadaceae bacterium]